LDGHVKFQRGFLAPPFSRPFFLLHPRAQKMPSHIYILPNTTFFLRVIYGSWLLARCSIGSSRSRRVSALRPMGIPSPVPPKPLKKFPVVLFANKCFRVSPSSLTVNPACVLAIRSLPIPPPSLARQIAAQVVPNSPFLTFLGNPRWYAFGWT